ncbi:DNA sulfur modification protein DndD [Methylomonas fluvii]|uniref:DNA sulfur modification protein DndD n=1 Tax=Methylomonas fluvii TaxID=1854564 RepID=A0ABR9DH70_9GAMM|nr:DNA sulfur modification protein DndD [Methylomonas fluvii]MBD9362275.1 DNA sulfur modification protein DndD [Methylomonas fluvii]
MILESLKVNNFRVFKGEHEFALAPRYVEGNLRPIILFGGLNGAGKTTMLTAIRLALYGRQSLGPGTTQKNYYQFLSDSIHNSKTTGVKANNASVELIFSYANLGVISHYHIKRSWTMSTNKVDESLKIAQDGHPIHNLSYEQAQGFLNELIPIGVSDLFFFDGEKIADLAEDSVGNALGDSVKKLIGLDLIEKLSADITVYIRNQNKQKLSEDIKANINTLEVHLEEQKKAIASEQEKYGTIRYELAYASTSIDQLNNNLNAQGGAWAATREKEIAKLTSYKTEKELLESQLREVISDSFPFSIAPEYINRCLGQLEHEATFKHSKSTAKIISKHLASLEKRLSSIIDQPTFSIINEELQTEFSDLFNIDDKCHLIHDVSDSLHKNIESILTDAIKHQKTKTDRLAKAIETINQKIDDAGINIARAPEQDVLVARIKELNEAQETKSKLEIQAAEQKNLLKGYLREAMNTVKVLNQLHTQYIDSDETNRALVYAHKAKKALNEFAKRVAINKIKNVESEFTESYKRFARKSDTNISAKIEPLNFSVKLFDDFGSEVPKGSLSAGERQIYAVAMLDALTKTSGRKLPIIIDTPLGRLDSKHRKKLVENYFPNASHQVIILSTDTEIDKTYYSFLKDYTSHTIMLDYIGLEGTSNIEEGYFWQSLETA